MRTHMWEAAKAVLKEKLITLNAKIRMKGLKSILNYLPQETGEEQSKSLASRRKKIKLTETLFQ